MNRLLTAVLFLLIVPFVHGESVLITVVDPLNNLVDGASIQSYCDQLQAGITDQFGTYYTNVSGDCKAYARFKDAVGVVSFNSKNSPEVTITLDKTIITLPAQTVPSWPFAIIIVLIALAVAGYVLKTKKSTPKSEKRSSDFKIDAVLDVLGEREKQIVQHLLKNNGQSSQAKIRYDTGLPKASISRNIKNLESKNVISVQSIGNFKRITLKK